MKLLQRSCIVCMLIIVFPAIPQVALAAANSVPIEQRFEQAPNAFQEKIKNLNAKQKEKFDHKVAKIKKKVAKRKAKGRDGVGTGLVIVGIGAIVAILGLVGLASILISIGLIVLILGLLFWLLGAI